MANPSNVVTLEFCLDDWDCRADVVVSRVYAGCAPQGPGWNHLGHPGDAPEYEAEVLHITAGHPETGEIEDIRALVPLEDAGKFFDEAARLAEQWGQEHSEKFEEEA